MGSHLDLDNDGDGAVCHGEHSVGVIAAMSPLNLLSAGAGEDGVEAEEDEQGARAGGPDGAGSAGARRAWRRTCAS
jgi:hypothetical protein